jgi:hypothetical protein
MTTAFLFAQVPSSPLTMTMAAAVEELLVQLLAKEEELTLHEEAIVVQEKGLEVSEQALGKVSLELNTEWVKTKAIVQ